MRSSLGVYFRYVPRVGLSRFSLQTLSTMHCAALRVPLRQAVASHRRSFVSTVLLTKAWENETVAELRKEARKRGLTSYVALFSSCLRVSLTSLKCMKQGQQGHFDYAPPAG